MSNSIPPPTFLEMPCRTPSALLGSTCLQVLAGNLITSTDLCPRCTATLMAGLIHAAPEVLVWSPFYCHKPLEATQ
ncbi:hypothetical protein [Nonomuraea longicatena]|uniref:Uncharacterized protein n=1 Tax=Nonomuraea longicatena TaxID=83682 RepID=A0ABP4BIK5_9ACTN